MATIHHTRPRVELPEELRQQAADTALRRRERIRSALSRGDAEVQSYALADTVLTDVAQPRRPGFPFDLFRPQLVGEQWIYPPYLTGDPIGAVVPNAPGYVAGTAYGIASLGWLSASAYVSASDAAGGAPHFAGVGEQVNGDVVTMLAPGSAGPLLIHSIPLSYESQTLAVVTVEADPKKTDNVTGLQPGVSGPSLDGYVAAFADLHLASYGTYTAQNLVTAIATNHVNYASPLQPRTIACSAILPGGTPSLDVYIWLTVEAVSEIHGRGYASIDLAEPFTQHVYGVERNYWGNQIEIPSIHVKFYQLG